jgi:hypothetical protein
VASITRSAEKPTPIDDSEAITDSPAFAGVRNLQLVPVQPLLGQLKTVPKERGKGGCREKWTRDNELDRMKTMGSGTGAGRRELDPAESVSAGRCRLCEGALAPRFTLKIRQRYDVGYFECADCLSLQTEPPYWLDEAYGDKSLANIDTGTVQRNIHNLAACFAISRIFNTKNVVDLGGGDGLLCRMLRDYGLNCYVKDKYATATYARGFTEQDFHTPHLVLGFEVLEHFPNPKSDVHDLFAYDADTLLLTTEIYSNQQKDWWYLAPETGQHVFFYSRKALELLAAKYRYSLIVSGGFILFARGASRLRQEIARVALKPRVCRMLRGLVVLLPAPGVWRDHLAQIQRSRVGPDAAHVARGQDRTNEPLNTEDRT